MVDGCPEGGVVEDGKDPPSGAAEAGVAVVGEAEEEVAACLRFLPG